jgi:cell division protease FtsH
VLERAKVRYTGAQERIWLMTLLSWVAPVLFFAVIWMLMFGKGRGAADVFGAAKSNARLLIQKNIDRHVAIDRPDVRGRDRILRLHAKRLTLAPDMDLSAVAAKTAGFAGADLANVVNEAALHAARENKAAVDMLDFDAAIDRAVVGLEKKNGVINPKEKETVAYHEAGHALIAELRATTDKVSRVSIIPRGIGALGFTQQLPTEDRYVMKRSELLDRFDVLLGGRIAEKLVYGEASTGAQDDLQRATDLVRHMITQYGMSDVLGAAVLEA